MNRSRCPSWPPHGPEVTSRPWSAGEHKPDDAAWEVRIIFVESPGHAWYSGRVGRGVTGQADAALYVLGELELRTGGRRIALGHARQRAVLAVLAVEADHVVSVDALIDRVWGAAAPRHVRSVLRTYVSHLRHEVALVGASIIRRGAGYVLEIDRDLVDVYQFHRLFAEARAQRDPQRSLDLVDKALGLWRGEPLAELDTVWAQETRERLRLERGSAEADRIDWALTCGRHDELLPELTTRTSERLLDERVVGQLMLALYRTGRQADALRRYQQIRQRLVEDVGADPGPALQRLHQRILEADPSLSLSTDLPNDAGAVAPSTFPVPRQLPRDLATFVDRDRELDVIGTLLEPNAASGAGPVVVVHGAPGAGKSALAIRAAHLSAARFPDGQLHVNLRSATPGVRPLSVAEGLHQLLGALGVAGTDLPAGTDEAAALLRTVVAGRRVLIVLDDAANAAQVRPLLAGCAVLVTSRTRLTTLEGATHQYVGPLSAGAAYAMLDGLISDSRPAIEPQVTRRLAELCDHLPLGLHVAAARLNGRPSWAVRDLVDRLVDERDRLAELATGDIALRSSLAVSHNALRDSDDTTDQRSAWALCLFGLLPITEIDLDLAAAVLDTKPAEADRVIERLLNAHLAEETAPGRFHLHDLTRLFARELGADTIPLDALGTALTRVLNYYLATVATANALVYAHRTHYLVPEATLPPKPLADRDEALQWLDEQRRDMIAIIRQVWRGSPESVRLGVDLALALHWYLYSGAHDLHGTVSFLEEVVEAAQRLGDRRAQAAALGTLAGNLRHIGQLDDACAHTSVELAICREIGDRFGEQRALGNLGYTHLAQHRPDHAIKYLQQQLDLAREIDAPIGQAFALVNLGKAHHQLGQSDDAIQMIKEGLAWYETTGDHYRQCDVHEILARIHLDLGRHDQAIALMARGLSHARGANYRYGEI